MRAWALMLLAACSAPIAIGCSADAGGTEPVISEGSTHRSLDGELPVTSAAATSEAASPSSTRASVVHPTVVRSKSPPSTASNETWVPEGEPQPTPWTPPETSGTGGKKDPAESPHKRHESIQLDQ